MKNKKYLFPIALLISLLIILIPVAVAAEIDSYDNLVLKTAEQRIGLYQNPGNESNKTYTPSSAERTPFERSYLSDPGKACVAQHEETSSFADTLDNSVISTLEKIASVLFAICTTMSAIDTVMSTAAMAVGMWSGPCCTPPMMVCPGPCGAPCTAMDGIYKSWSGIYVFVKPLCCFVNCGWCTGGDCFSILSGISLGAIPNVGIAGPGGGIGQFGLSPYDNIYTAIGCLCPIAIIFNLRKLKTIYDVYDCCIQEACENSLSTDACERQLDEATCMYWEGSIYSILAKILLSILTNIIASKLVELFGLSNLLSCLYAVLKLVQVPRVISGVMSAWGYMGRTFNKPNCKDLGFKKVKEQSEAAMREAAKEGFEDIDESLLENWEYITLVDKNNDGIYDYSSSDWKLTNPDAKKESRVYQKTLRLYNDKTGEYESKTYYRKEGKIYSDEAQTQKVGSLEWQKLQGSAAPTRVTLASDGSARIGDSTYNKFEVTQEGKIKFTGTKDGKTVSEILDLAALGDTKIPGTSYKFSDFEKIDNQGNLIKGTAGEEGYKKITFTQEGKQIEITEGTAAKTVNLNTNGAILISSNKGWTYQPTSKVSITGTGTAPDEATLSSLVKQAEMVGVNVDGSTASVGDDNKVKISKGGQEYNFDIQNNKVEHSQTVEGIVIKRNIDTKTGVSTTATLTSNKVNYNVPPALIDEIGAENIKNIQKQSDGQTVISYGDKKTATVNKEGSSATFFSKTGATERILTVADGGKKITDTQGDITTVKETLVGGDGSIVKVTQQFEKDVATGTVKLEINGKTTKVTADNFKDMPIDNPDQIAIAYEKLGSPDEFGYQSQTGNFFIGEEYTKSAITVSITNNVIEITEWDQASLEGLLAGGVRTNKKRTIKVDTSNPEKKKEIMTEFDNENNAISEKTITSNADGMIINVRSMDKDGNSYDFDIDPVNQQVKNFRYEDLIFTGDITPQGDKEIYHFTLSEGAPLENEYFNVGFDQDGEMWLKKVYDESWTKASEIKDPTLDEDILKDELKRLQKKGKVAISLKRQIEEQAKEKIEEAEKKAAEEKKIAQKEAENEVAYNMMYERVWALLDLTLGESINNFIEDKCKEDSKKSYPPGDKPTDGGGREEPAECENNVYNAQFISKDQLTSTCEYKVTYSIKNCNNATLSYTVFFAGTGSVETIESGSLGLGQTISRNRIVESALCTHQTICITADDGHNQCYPPLPHEG